jgi:hypothetical protein
MGVTMALTAAQIILRALNAKRATFSRIAKNRCGYQ